VAKRRTRPVMFATVVLAAVVLSACGGSGTDPELKAKVADQFQVLLPLDDTQADCMADQMLNIYGDDEMTRFVNDPDNFTPTEEASSEITAKALEDCGINPFELVQERQVGDTQISGELDLGPQE
jgi:hypothetical protein